MASTNRQKFIAIFLTVIGLALFYPLASLAAENSSSSCANSTSTMTVAQRQECDAQQKTTDENNLKTIRNNEDVTQAQNDCKSSYSPSNTASQTSIISTQYVPVHETGDLLTVTQNTNSHIITIDKFTGKNYDMNILLCMYLHAIKRVEYAMEDLTFVKEPDMRRQAATKVEEYKKGLLGDSGLIKTGYKPSGEMAESSSSTSNSGSIDKTKLYPENLNSYLSDAGDEGYGVFMDDYKNYSGNSFTSDVEAKLKEDAAVGGTNLNSTIPKDTYDSFMGSDSKNLSPDQWWADFTSIFDITRPNNPYNSYLYAYEEMQAAQQQSKELALQEYQSGRGFLPVRTCIEHTSDGKYCRAWKTTTPGQSVAQSANDAVSARINEYTNPELGQVGNGNEPNTNEVQTFTPTAGTGGGNIGNTLSSIVNSLWSYWDYFTNNDNSNNDSSGSGSGSGSSSGDGSTTLPPIVQIYANNVNDGTRVITWASANTTRCSAKNDWLGSTNKLTKLVTIVKNRSQFLSSASGSITTEIPLSFKAEWSYNGSAYSSEGMATSTTASLTGMKVTWYPTDPKSANDSYTLKISDGDQISGFTITVGGSSSPLTATGIPGVVAKFREFAATNPYLPVYERYNFIYNDSGTNPNIVIELKEPVYIIECSGADGSTAGDSTE